MQKLRIQQGNRIVAAFKFKLGIMPGQSEKEADAYADNLLTYLRTDSKRITDGVKRLTTKVKFEGEQLITSYSELLMINAYEKMLESEAMHEKAIQEMLNHEPIWTEYLKDIRGVGPLMAGVILSEIDFEKCESISALWKYCGVDVNVWFEIKNCFRLDAPDRLYQRHPKGYTTKGFDITGIDKNWFSLYDMEGNIIADYGLPDPTSPGFGEGRCKKATHLVKKSYVNADGEIKDTVGITYNPFLKTKLVGVLGSVFIKLGGKYREVYDVEKLRLQNHPKHVEKSKGHIHNMAVRFMIKEFLADLWTAGRTINGLPLKPSYYDAKIKPLLQNKAA
jgi:hypothetical protein